MAVYVVVFDDDTEPPQDEERIDKVEKHYPGDQSYYHSDSVFFVHTNDVSSDVKRKLKIGREGNDAGFIIQVGKAYTGYTSAGLWEWLAKATRS